MSWWFDLRLDAAITMNLYRLESVMDSHSVSAIILSAGFSSRMGSFKPLLKIGKSPILERVVRLFLEASVDDVIVVVGHRWSELVLLVEDRGVRYVRNRQFESGMFSSVQVGVSALRPETEAFFMLPVDIPMVRPQTIRALLSAYKRGQGAIIYPMFAGKRGHPPLISAEYRDEILSHNGDGGLRSVLQIHEDQSFDADVADEMILVDVDTSEDYDALVKALGR